jgi:hypothetical protein
MTTTFNKDDVFTIDKDNVKDFDPVDEVVFCLRGLHDYMYQDIPCIKDLKKQKAVDRKEACAKKVKHWYFIKINSKGELYNPLDVSHERSYNRVQNGIPVWSFKKVPYSTFAHYAHFLQTRNLAFMNLARREIGMVN